MSLCASSGEMEAQEGMPYWLLWVTNTWVHMSSREWGERTRLEGVWLVRGTALPRWMAAVLAMEGRGGEVEGTGEVLRRGEGRE